MVTSYWYKGCNQNGLIEEGFIEAEGEGPARLELQRKGIRPTTLCRSNIVFTFYLQLKNIFVLKKELRKRTEDYRQIHALVTANVNWSDISELSEFKLLTLPRNSEVFENSPLNYHSQLIKQLGVNNELNMFLLGALVSDVNAISKAFQKSLYLAVFVSIVFLVINTMLFLLAFKIFHPMIMAMYVFCILLESSLVIKTLGSRVQVESLLKRFVSWEEIEKNRLFLNIQAWVISGQFSSQFRFLLSTKYRSCYWRFENFMREGKLPVEALIYCKVLKDWELLAVQAAYNSSLKSGNLKSGSEHPVFRVLQEVRVNEF